MQKPSKISSLFRDFLIKAPLPVKKCTYINKKTCWCFFNSLACFKNFFGVSFLKRLKVCGKKRFSPLNVNKPQRKSAISLIFFKVYVFIFAYFKSKWKLIHPYYNFLHILYGGGMHPILVKGKAIFLIKYRRWWKSIFLFKLYVANKKAISFK